MVFSFSGVARLRPPAAGEDPGRLVRVAEGATAPESLRQKDRGGERTLWKAPSCAKGSEGHRWGKPPKPLGEEAKLSGFPTEGVPVKMPAAGIAGRVGKRADER